MSVYQLFGGALRTEIDLYWTHCGSFRVKSPDLFERLMNRERLIDLNGMQRLGKEVAASGFRAAKTNPILFNADGATLLNPGFVPEGLDHAGTISHEILVAIEAQMEAFRDGAGWSTELMLDVNFAYSPPSVAQLEACIRQFSLRWLEYDHRGAANLADLRQRMGLPLASLETIYECVGYRPYLEKMAVDIAVVDILWNGFSEAIRIANLCAVHGINVAPHNFYGPMADLIAANFSAVVPNLEIMEFEDDDVPWKYDLLTQPPIVVDGKMMLPAGAGWGADINETALKEHPWGGRA
jgi:L-alanine-DL-glutamate epimerase-like enolase superfamily enzyme